MRILFVFLLVGVLSPVMFAAESDPASVMGSLIVLRQATIAPIKSAKGVARVESHWVNHDAQRSVDVPKHLIQFMFAPGMSIRHIHAGANLESPLERVILTRGGKFVDYVVDSHTLSVNALTGIHQRVMLCDEPEVWNFEEFAVIPGLLRDEQTFLRSFVKHGTVSTTGNSIICEMLVNGPKSAPTRKYRLTFDALLGGMITDYESTQVHVIADTGDTMTQIDNIKCTWQRINEGIVPLAREVHVKGTAVGKDGKVRDVAEGTLTVTFDHFEPVPVGDDEFGLRKMDIPVGTTVLDQTLNTNEEYSEGTEERIFPASPTSVRGKQ